MAPANKPIAIAELHRTLERMEAHGPSMPVILPFGLAAVDERLPRSGLEIGHLHEIIEGGRRANTQG